MINSSSYTIPYYVANTFTIHLFGEAIGDDDLVLVVAWPGNGFTGVAPGVGCTLSAARTRYHLELCDLGDSAGGFGTVGVDRDIVLQKEPKLMAGFFIAVAAVSVITPSCRTVKIAVLKSD